MGTLRIRLLGSLRVTISGHPHEIKLTRNIQQLLAYLVLHRQRPPSREVLAELFWERQRRDQALSCLSTALWRLRRALEPEPGQRGAFLSMSSTGEVTFNPHSDYWLDVAEFETVVNRIVAEPARQMQADDAERLAHTLQLYEGDLLESFYDDWLLAEREHLRCLYLNSLARLTHYYRDQGAFDLALSCGQRILGLDPLREEIHRELIRIYMESGQRVLAVRQYELCRQTLAGELGIEPMEETRALYSEIMADSLGTRPTPPEQNYCLAQIRRDLRHTLKLLDQTRGQLEGALRLIDDLTHESTQSTRTS